MDTSGGPGAAWMLAGRLARIAPPSGLVAATGLLVWPAFAHAAEVWATVAEFSFGFLVPPISAFLVWRRRAALRRDAGSGGVAGLAIVLASLAAYLLAHRVGINAAAGLAVSPLLWGIVVYLRGWDAGRALAFPIGFLAFGLGLYRGLLDSVGFALQGVTAVGAASLGLALGVPVAREGLVLRSEEFAFVVAEACSGMSSLLALLALAALWTYAARGSLPARLVVALSVAPLVIAANMTRVACVLLVAHWFGQDAAVGFFHGASSLVLFGLAVAGLVAVSRLSGCRAPEVAV